MSGAWKNPAVFSGVCYISGQLRISFQRPPKRQKGGVVPLIDLKAVKAMVRLDEVLDLLRYQCVRRSLGKGYGLCPLKCGERPRACALDFESGVWFCHACQRGGNVLDLYALAKGINVYAAALELCQALGILVPFKNGYCYPPLPDGPRKGES